MRKLLLAGVVLAMALLVGVGWRTPAAEAAPGTLLGTVTLPGNGVCSVAGTFDGTNYITVNSGVCAGTTLGIYDQPGTGAATLLFSKPIIDDGVGNPVTISAVAWDPSPGGGLWAAYAGNIYLINISGASAVATLQFTTTVGGSALVDGLAYDAGGNGTLYYSPDVNCNVYHFSLGRGGDPALGTLMNTVTPKNSLGQSDCLVSGVVVGSANTLYIGRNGDAEIRRVDKTTGAFISQFATTSGRVEDLTCDPVTYAPNEAILAKDAYNGLFEAFEVERGTCPLPAPSVGGITQHRVSSGLDAPADASASSSERDLVVPIAAAAAAAFVALAAGGWYTRRRWLR